MTEVIAATLKPGDHGHVIGEIEAPNVTILAYWHVPSDYLEPSDEGYDDPPYLVIDIDTVPIDSGEDPPYRVYVNDFAVAGIEVDE